MSAVAKLKAVLGMDTRQFKAGMRGADQQMGAFQRKVSSVGKTLVAAFSVAAITRWSTEIIKVGRSLHQVSQNLGVSTDALQAFVEVGRKWGINADQMRDRASKLIFQFGRLEKSVDTDLGRAFARAGISIEELESSFGNFDKQVALIGTALKRIGEGPEAASARAAFLGTVYAEENQARLQQPFIEMSNGLAGLTDEFKDANLVMSSEAISAAEAMGNAWEKQIKRARVFSSDLAVATVAEVKRGVGWIQKTIQNLTGIDTAALLKRSRAFDPRFFVPRVFGQWAKGHPSQSDAYAMGPPEPSGTGTKIHPDEALKYNKAARFTDAELARQKVLDGIAKWAEGAKRAVGRSGSGGVGMEVAGGFTAQGGVFSGGRDNLVSIAHRHLQVSEQHRDIAREAERRMQEAAVNEPRMRR